MRPWRLLGMARKVNGGSSFRRLTILSITYHFLRRIFIKAAVRLRAGSLCNKSVDLQERSTREQASDQQHGSHKTKVRIVSTAPQEERQRFRRPNLHAEGGVCSQVSGGACPANSARSVSTGPRYLS